MVTPQHSFTAATLTAHRDVLAAVRAMPWLGLIVIGILALQIMLELAAGLVIPRGSLFGRDILGALHYALLTPLFIAVHRLSSSARRRTTTACNTTGFNRLNALA